MTDEPGVRVLPLTRYQYLIFYTVLTDALACYMSGMARENIYIRLGCECGSAWLRGAAI